MSLLPQPLSDHPGFVSFPMEMELWDKPGKLKQCGLTVMMMMMKMMMRTLVSNNNDEDAEGEFMVLRSIHLAETIDVSGFEDKGQLTL